MIAREGTDSARFSGLQRILAGAFLCAAVLMCTSLAFAEAVNVEFLIDDSGSMAAQVGGRSKIAIAKEVFSGLLGDLPPDANVALRTYGRRRRRDCSDLELLLPFGPGSRSQFTKSVQDLKPHGMTPIAASLQAAAGDFAGKEGQRNVLILLSDGLEDCHGDPCTEAKALHAAGIDLQVNVIGFNVGQKERSQLECIAEKGGGRYFDARNAGELKLAASTAAKAVAEDAPPPAPATPAQSNLLSAASGGRLIAGPDSVWAATNDGKEDYVYWFQPGQEGIYGFKDGHAATFDAFEVLISQTRGDNLKEFELSSANSLNGPWKPIGKFTTQNIKFFQKPFQEFKFSPVIARYFKVKLLSAWSGATSGKEIQITEFRLLGKIDETSAAERPSGPKPDEVNLLGAPAGGHLVAAPGDVWAATNDGNENYVYWFQPGQEAIYSFNGEQAATFDDFQVLVLETRGDNVKDFELYAADSASGPWRSIGSFQTQNIRFFQKPYQDFMFPPVTAKYLKVKLVSAWSGATSGNEIQIAEFRLMGKVPAGK